MYSCKFIPFLTYTAIIVTIIVQGHAKIWWKIKMKLYNDSFSFVFVHPICMGSRVTELSRLRNGWKIMKTKFQHIHVGWVSCTLHTFLSGYASIDPFLERPTRWVDCEHIFVLFEQLFIVLGQSGNRVNVRNLFIWAIACNLASCVREHSLLSYYLEINDCIMWGLI